MDSLVQVRPAEVQPRPGPDQGAHDSAELSPLDFAAGDLEASWHEWFTGADLADEPALALRLLAARPAGDPDEAQSLAVDRARLLLLAGRPADALDALAAVGIDELPAGPATDPTTALLAACRAAAGEPGSYRWLLAGLRNTEWAGSWHAGYVVAVAAEARGDHDTADEMWLRVLRVHAIRTRHVLVRAAVALVWRRDRDDAAGSCESAFEAATLLDSLSHGVAADPAVVAAATGLLGARGDHDGVALLLRAVDRCTSADLPDRPDGRHLRGPARAAWRALGGLRLRTTDGVARIAEGDPRGGYLLAAAVGAAALSGVAALVTVGWVATLPVGFAAGYLLARTLHRRGVRSAHRAALAALHRAQERQTGRCACFETPVVTGALVTGVLTHHLRTLPAGDPLTTATRDTVGADATLAWCPATGYLWFHPGREPGRQDLLLRGQVAVGRPGDELTTTSVPTGFYL